MTNLSANFFASSPVHNSNDPSIIPIGKEQKAYSNRHEYSSEMGAKKHVEFGRPLFKELIVIIKRDDCGPEDDVFYKKLLSYIYGWLKKNRNACNLGQYSNGLLNVTEDYDH